MDRSAITQSQVAVWTAMADQFLDTETREGIPWTAQLCLEAGLSVDQARDVWRYEVSPAVSFNLYLVAGEWGCWDQDWLLDRILRTRTRGRGWFARLWYGRLSPIDGVWLSIERCMLALLELPQDERASLARDLSFLARHYFDFASGSQPVPDSESLARLVQRTSLALHVLAPAALSEERTTSSRRLAEALRGPAARTASEP